MTGVAGAASRVESDLLEDDGAPVGLAPGATPGVGREATVPLRIHAVPAAAAGTPEEPRPAAAPGPAAEPAAPPAPAATRSRRRGAGTGARERKRLETRATIVDAAAELFAERGFDHVSVVEIAQRAGVVEKTVFNHFPVKEGLVFEADPPMRAALLEAVRRRRQGESAAAAAGRFVVAAVSQLGRPEAAGGVVEMARVIRGSRTLQVREREILGELTGALAEQLTLETRADPGDLRPWLAAHTVLGLYAALLELARDRVLAGAGGAELVEELRDAGRRGLALLQTGLAGYAERR